MRLQNAVDLLLGGKTWVVKSCTLECSARFIIELTLRECEGKPLFGGFVPLLLTLQCWQGIVPIVLGLNVSPKLHWDLCTYQDELIKWQFAILCFPIHTFVLVLESSQMWLWLLVPSYVFE